MTAGKLSSNLNHLRRFGWRALSYRLRAALTKRPGEGHVLVIHTGRAGSTVLGDLLDQHSQICWDGEIFEKFLHHVSARENIGIDKLYGRYSIDDIVGEFTRRMDLVCGSRIFGAELQDYHLEITGTDLPSLIERLRPLGFTRFIVLERENTLRKVVSTIVATERRTFHVDAKQQVQTKSIRINPQRMYLSHRRTTLLDFLDHSRQFLADARELLAGDDLLELYYHQDIEEDPRDGYRKVCAFLGLEPENPRVKLGKTTAQPLYETIENYDELSDLLSATDHAWMAPRQA